MKYPGKLKKLARYAKTSQAQALLMKTLDWAYDYAVNKGLPGLSSAPKLAEDFLKKSPSVKEACNNMIRWQLAYAGSAGFVTNIGGMLTLPVSIPSNIATVLFVQVRLISAIAYMGGYDLKSEQVRTAVFLSLLGGGANMVLDSVGVQLASKLTATAINQISESALARINQAVGFVLVSKFGTTGVLSVGKVVPFIGGLVGGTLDVLTTNVIANAAKKMFLGEAIERELLTELEVLRIQALINMAKVDGEMSEEEKEVIETLIYHSDLPEEEKSALSELMDKSELVKIDFSPFKKNQAYAYSLVNSLVSLIWADKKMQTAEKMYLMKIAKEIGIPAKEREEMLNPPQ